MTIIESVRNFISECPHLSEFAEGINVDYLDSRSTSYSIEEVPSNPIIKKYIDGSSVRQYLFLFTSRESYGQDVIQNLENSGFYEHFALWLEKQSDIRKLPSLDGNREAITIEAITNGYAFATDIDKAQYQIQCKLVYYQGGIK